MNLDWKLRVLKWLMYVLALVLVVVTVVPLAGKWVVEGQLEAQGFQTKIRNLKVGFLSGKITFSGVAIKNPAGERLNADRAALDLNLKKLFEGEIHIEIIECVGASMDINLEPEQLKLGGFSIEGLLDRLSSFDSSPVIGHLRFENSDFCDPALSQCIRVENLSLGGIQLKKEGEGWRFVQSTPLVADKLVVRESKSNASLLFSSRVSIASSSIDSSKTSLADISVSNTQFFDRRGDSKSVRSKFDLHVGDVNLSKFDYQASPNRKVSFGDLDVVSLKQGVVKNKRDPMQKLQLLTDSWFPELSRTISEGISGDGSVGLDIESVSVHSSDFKWLDVSVNPPVSEHFSGIRMELASVGGGKEGELSLSGKFGEEGSFSFEGALTPLGPEPKLSGKLLVTDWELSNVVAYTPELFKQTINSGSVSFATDLDVRQGRINGESSWDLRRLRFPGRANGGRNSMPGSYNLIKDRSESVRFTLPIRGKTADIYGTIQHVLGNQVRRKIITMARSEVTGLGEESNPQKTTPGKLSFRSISYDSRKRTPEGADLSRLKEVADLLLSKPHLVVTMCPVTTGGEWAVMYNDGTAPDISTILHPEEKQEMLDLASARGKVLRRSLMEAQVSYRQIVICEPRIDMSLLGPSFASISL